MARYKVKHTSILHNGKLYPEGKTINLKEEDAIKLADFIEIIPEQTSNNDSSKGKSTKNASNKTSNDEVNKSTEGDANGEQ